MSGSTSTKIGVAPTYAIGAAVAIQVVSGTITSSPGPTPMRQQAEVEGGRARRQGDGRGASGGRRELLLERPGLVAGVLVPRVASRVGHGVDLAVGDPRTGDRNSFGGLGHATGATRRSTIITGTPLGCGDERIPATVRTGLRAVKPIGAGAGGSVADSAREPRLLARPTRSAHRTHRVQGRVARTVAGASSALRSPAWRCRPRRRQTCSPPRVSIDGSTHTSEMSATSPSSRT